MSANEVKRPLRVATAFSGGLAAVEFALRYENINHEVIFACEWDKFARQQYLAFHHAPGTFYNDISDLDAKKYRGQIDLFVWGSPCQDLSLAGKRKGFNGEKSSLFREGARVQKEMMPKNFIFENVKGLLSSNKGADYKEVCKTFRDMGYHIHTTVMNTKDFGVPQNRERVFIIGFLDEKEYHAYKEPQAFKLETKLKDLLENEVDEKYFLSKKMIDGFTSGASVFKERFNPIDIDKQDYGFCLDCKCGGGRRTSNFIKVKSATKKGYEVATENDSINFTHPDSKTRRGRVGKNVAQTLDTACNQGVIQSKVSANIKESVRNNFIRDYNEIIKSDKNVFYSDCESGYQDNKVCLTESACLRANNDNLFALDNKSCIRKLTPKECYRLQGVRDNDIKLTVSDTQAYKIAGNAISVNVMQYLLKSLYKQDLKSTSLLDFLGVA